MFSCERFVNSRFTSNTYVISCPERDDVWLVDPGDTEVVFEWMRNHSKTIVSGILLTHAHFDHIYGINDILLSYPSCVVYVANAYGKELLFDARKNASKYTEEGPMVVRGDASVSYYPEQLQLWDGIFLSALYTPGHSDDSECLIVGDMLFSGDTLIKDIRTVTKLKTGSRDKLKSTLSMLEKLKGRGLTVYPGHEDKFLLDSYNLDNSLGTALLPVKSA